MTTFLIHGGQDREDGEIHQTNKVYYPDANPKRGRRAYADVLNERGSKFVAIPHGKGNLAMHRSHFVHKGELRKRGRLPIQVDKTEVEAGGKDAAKFKFVPDGTTVSITTGGMALTDGFVPVQGKNVELPIPVPGVVYVVTFRKWPYQDVRFEVVSK
jgi:hypothetical protein